jgi:hypothetical protein
MLLWIAAALASCDLSVLKSAMDVLDGDLQSRWWAVPAQVGRVEQAMKCTKDQIDMRSLIRLHHQLAVAACIDKNFNLAAEHLVAAWLISPMTELPALIPTTSPARVRFVVLQEKVLNRGKTVRLDKLAAVDGHYAGWVFADLPMIVQPIGEKARLME